jgi:hypothetical protein
VNFAEIVSRLAWAAFAMARVATTKTAVKASQFRRGDRIGSPSFCFLRNESDCRAGYYLLSGDSAYHSGGVGFPRN